ncbi:serine/threonine protein kinase, partial [Trifolium pratense]
MKLTDQGSLVILDGSKGIIWNSDSSRIGVEPVVQLLDSGNLVVKDANNTQNFLWESFDYPGDTLLAGMKLKSNSVTGPYRYLTSWRSPEDPATGEYSYRIDMHGYPQLVTEKGSRILYRGGSWNGILFTGVPWQRLYRIYNFSAVITDKEFSYQYENLDNSIITRVVLDQNGITQRLTWSDRTQIWEATSTRPADECDVYALCGINSNCNVTDFPNCKCLEGFVPKFQTKWKSSNWTDGCVRKTDLNCSHGDGFLKYTSMKLPDTSSSWFNKSLSLEKCKTMCLKNCSCTAYANLDIRNNGSGCLLWFDNIVDMRNFPDQGQDIYIRLSSSELGVIALIIGLTLIVMVTLAYRKKLGCIRNLFQKKDMEDGDSATIFDFSTITSATNHFSNRNKLGEGGFGPVYKGITVDGQEIAVKRLSKTSIQGIEEFKNE